MPFNYWDIDEIISEEQLLSCHTRVEIADCGFLDPEEQELDLPENAKVDLPLWLAQVLYRREIVKLHMPAMFKGMIKEDLEKDAAVCNLRRRSPFYLQTGMKLGYLLDDKEQVALLMTAMGTRWREIVRVLGKALLEVQDPPPALVQRLTFLEEKMLFGGREANTMFQRWWDNFGRSVIEAAPTAQRPAKRLKR